MKHLSKRSTVFDLEIYQQNETVSGHYTHGGIVYLGVILISNYGINQNTT